MQVSVLLFAQLADALGRRDLMLELENGATVESALDLLCSRHPQIASMRDQIAVAVDERYAQPQAALQPGQTLALIPPVSGG